MRRSGKARISELVCCAVAAIALLGGAAISWAITDCRKPNPKTKPCYTAPPGSVRSCAGQTTQATCTAVYAIADFPDGDIKNDTGRVKTENADCWDVWSCIWDTTYPEHPVCMCDPNGFAPVNRLPMVITDDYNSCPTEE